MAAGLPILARYGRPARGQTYYGQLLIRTDRGKMEVKEAVKMAKEHIRDLYEGEKIVNLGLEEVELSGNVWRIAVGFSRPWDSVPRDMLGHPQGPRERSYKVVRISDSDGRVLSVESHSADMA